MRACQIPKRESIDRLALREAVNRATAANTLRQLIDRVFAFDEVKEAYRHPASQSHLGNIVVRID